MAKGIGAGVQPQVSLWGDLTEEQIGKAKTEAVERAQLAGRDVRWFEDLDPEERRAARRLALRAHE